jgi:uncharacterized protein YcbX
MTGVTVTDLMLHPLKGGLGSRVNRLAIGPTGPVYDRRWAFRNSNGCVVTQRGKRGQVEGVPGIRLVRALVQGDRLVLQAPDMPDLEVPVDGIPNPATVSLKIWRDEVPVSDQGPAAAAWGTEYLNRSRRRGREAYSLVRLPDAPVRHAAEGTVGTNAADKWPITLMSRATLAVVQETVDDIVDETGAPPFDVTVEYFRPTIVVDGLPAFGEDTIWGCYIRDLTFMDGGPNKRCIMVTYVPGSLDQRVEVTQALERLTRVSGTNDVTLARNLGIVPFAGLQRIEVDDRVVVVDAI